MRTVSGKRQWACIPEMKVRENKTVKTLSLYNCPCWLDIYSEIKIKQFALGARFYVLLVKKKATCTGISQIQCSHL